MHNPIFTLDSEVFYVDVVALQREFSLAEGQTSCVTLDGQHHRQVQGTYYNYTMTVRARPGLESELERFWEAVSRPVASVTCSFPYGQDTITQKMYIQEGSQPLLASRGWGNRWDQITLRFLAALPQVNEWQ